MLGIEKKLFSLDKNLPIAGISSNCIDFVQFLIDYEYIAGCKNGFARYLNHERENDSLLTTVLLGELARTRFVSKKTLKKIYEGKLFQYNDEEEFSGHRFYSEFSLLNEFQIFWRKIASQSQSSGRLRV
ncbi:MAG: hypothetical protein ACXQT5_03920 [Candidatus Syntropharchaeia archaeon]